MIVTSIKAKLTVQENPDYTLELSNADLTVIIDGMANTQSDKLNNPSKNYELVNTLRKLKALGELNITERV